MENLAKAIVAVMKEIKGIEKTTEVGFGASAYKGVPDQEVKKIIGESMQRNGLSILPIEVEPTVELNRWEESYNGTAKQKQSVFTTVRTKYLLLHISGESQVISGYGHGADSQDKGAGKATTYALKYTLLYLFMVPTGKIDDSDTTHSEQIEAPKLTVTPGPKPYLNESSGEFEKAVEYLKSGGSLDKIESKYKLSDAVRESLLSSAI